MAAIGDLPVEVITDVLSRVPSWDLVRNCRLVCSRWQEVADALNAPWKLRCQREGLAKPGGDVRDWRTLHFLWRSRRNLLRNPCGEEGFNFWEVNPEEVEEDAWSAGEIEGFPLAHVTSGFGAFSGPGPKKQLITLQDYGYWDELMDQVKPDIKVNDWTDVFDPYIYTLNVQLLSADHQVLRQCVTADVSVTTDAEELWSEISYTFQKYPAGVRHVLFQHKIDGVDSGTVTNSSVTVEPNF